MNTLKPRIKLFSVLILSSLSLFCFQNCSPFGDPGHEIQASPFGSVSDDSLAYKSQCSSQAALKKVELQRLTNFEYKNVVQDLFETAVDDSDFPMADESGTSGFKNDTQRMNNPSMLLNAAIQSYFQLGLKVAAAVMTNKSNLVLVCTNNNDTCKTNIINQLGKKLFRRPLTTGPNSELAGLKTVMASETTLSKGVELVLATLLSSPNFLYKSYGSYAAPVNGLVALDRYEIATRLSFLLWSSTPDDTLLNSDLTNANVRSQQISRMLQSSKANRLATGFGDEWFKYSQIKNITIDPEFTVDPEVLAGAALETESFIGHVLRNSPRLLDLYDANYSFVNNKLAAFYGISGSYGNSMTLVTNLGTQRGGLLGQMSILASGSAGEANTHPTSRGLWVVNEILCHQVDPAPTGIDFERVKGIAKTPSEFARLHASIPMCQSCHSVMDPIGLGLENYNAIGQWQTTYEHGNIWGGKGIAVEAAGALGGKPFATPAELKSLIGETQKTHNCLSKKIYSYALGRALENRDYCASETAADEVVANGGSFEDVINQLASSEVFLKGVRSE